MITEYDVLQPDIQPDREVIVHRDEEIDHLTAVLKSLTEGVAPNGPSSLGRRAPVRPVSLGS